MSFWLLSIGLLTNNIRSQTYDAYMDNQWYQQELNCTNYYCEIYCDQYQSCYQTTINANTASELTITCSESYACRSMHLYANYTQTLTINCEYDGACSYMDIYAKNAGTINFNPYSRTSGAQLFVQQASYIYIDCNDTDSCQQMNVYATNAGSITVTAKHDQSWYYGKLYADNANSIYLTCISKQYKYACYGPAWYLPSNGENTYINCYGTGCQSTNNILTDNSVSSLSNIYINGCNECDNDRNSCAQFSFLCMPSGSTDSSGYYSSYNYDEKDTFYAGSCDNDNACNCVTVENSFSWENNRYDSNCILSDWNTEPISTTPSPTYYGYSPTYSYDPGSSSGSGSSIKLTPDFGYYVGGIVYLLFILVISILFIKLGYKDRQENALMKETWVHANNQRKQNKKNANYVYSNVSQVSTQLTPLPDGWREAYTAGNKMYYQNDITKETKWERPQIGDGKEDNVQMATMNVKEEPGANYEGGNVYTVQ